MTQPDERGVPLLVVDDDRQVREFVGLTLRLAGYQVTLVDDGDGMPDAIAKARPRLVVLDISMPRVSGLEALRRLRATGNSLPVIMLTALGEEEAKMTAFDAGADDYLVKPFSSRELVARVKAVLRRATQPARDEDAHSIVTVGTLSLHPREHVASVGDRRVELTRTEYALLLTLARSPGRVFTPPELLSRVWGAEYHDQPEILRTNIYRLRQKLEDDPRNPRVLCTRTGVGYYLATD